MDLDLNNLENQAVALLRDACSFSGIRNGPGEQNSQHLKARDSIIAGIAGLLAGDDRLCLSAAGLLFLISAVRKDSVKKLHIE